MERFHDGMICRHVVRVDALVAKAGLADEFQNSIGADDGVLELMVAQAAFAVGEQVGSEESQAADGTNLSQRVRSSRRPPERSRSWGNS